MAQIRQESDIGVLKVQIILLKLQNNDCSSMFPTVSHRVNETNYIVKKRELLKKL